MRRIIITLVTAFAVAALVPTVALARPAPKADSFAYAGVFGDIVGSGETFGVWNAADGAKDTVFSVQLAALTTKDLEALEIIDSGPNYWDTLSGQYSGWAIGVTARAHGKTLLNDLSSTAYTADLDGGLRVSLHVRADAGMLTSGEAITLTIRYSDATWTQLTTTMP